MSEQVTGKSLNLTFDMGSGGVIALRMVDDAGRALDMAGVTPWGEIGDEHTAEKLADLGCSWGASGEILVDFPAMERGRYVFHVFLRNDDGADVVGVAGYVGYSAPKELREESDIASVNRTLRVVASDGTIRALWSRTSAAEQAYNKVKAAQESVAEDITLLEGAKEVVEKLHGEIADAVTIAPDETWVIGGVRTEKPSRGERGENGLDADTVKRVEIASADELPAVGDGRHIYYVQSGTKASGWIRNEGGDWPSDIQLEINGVHVVVEQEGASLAVWAAAINAAPCGVVATVVSTPNEQINIEAERAGDYGNYITLQADAWALLSDTHLTGGASVNDVYIWGESVTGEEEWINVGSDPSNLKFASDSVAGIVMLSSPAVDDTFGGGIHRDAQGKIRVDDATETRKGAVRITSNTGNVNDYAECIGNTADKTQGGQQLGNGIGVLIATADKHGVVKLASAIGAQSDAAPSCAAVNSFTHSAAQSEIDDYVDEAGDAGNALSELIARKVQEAMTTAGVVPPGAEMDFAGENVPDGWLVCDGQEVSRADYAALFTAIGTRYGAGDGSTTFNVPDRRDLVTIMPTTLGQTGGRAIGSVQEAYAPNITGRFICSDWVAGKAKAYWENNGTYKPIMDDESQHEGCFMGVLYRGSGYTPTAYRQGLIAGTEGERFQVMDTEGKFFLMDPAFNGVTSTEPSGNYSSVNGCRMTFSAARSSDVYKNGVTTLMPRNAAVLKIIKC